MMGGTHIVLDSHADVDVYCYSIVRRLIAFYQATRSIFSASNTDWLGNRASGSARAQEVCMIPGTATPSARDAPNFSRLAASVAS